ISNETTVVSLANWRSELPTLTSRLVTPREPVSSDLRPLMDLLLLADASRFGIDEPVSEVSVQQLLDRISRDRDAGIAFTFLVTISSSRAVAGLVQTRQIELSWESAEGECTLAPSWG